MQIAIKPAAGRILVHIRNWKVLVCTWSLTLLPSIKILKYLVKSLLIHFPFHDLIGRVRMERGEVDCYPKEKIKFLWEVGLLLFFQKKNRYFLEIFSFQYCMICFVNQIKRPFPHVIYQFPVLHLQWRYCIVLSLDSEKYAIWVEFALFILRSVNCDCISK